MIRSILFSFIFFTSLSSETEYKFVGQHLLASFEDCDSRALKDLNNLELKMIEATKQSGATILSSIKHEFDSNGFTMVIFSESHASIHTYPEYNSCFIDFFTCGTKCNSSKFESALIDDLKPKNIAKRNFHRD